VEPAPAEEGGKLGGELNLLVMPGYEEEKIIKPFEEKYGVKINAKVYSTSDQMFSLLANSAEGEWDIVTPDTPWVAKLVDADLIDELNPKIIRKLIISMTAGRILTR